jgi:hypothetical protein
MLSPIVKKFLIYPLTLITLGMGQIALNASISSAQTKITFETYQKQCLDKIKNSGIQGKLAQDICNCTIATFKKRYSLEEFNQVVQKSKTDKAVAKQLAEVGEECFEKYLYE